MAVTVTPDVVHPAAHARKSREPTDLYIKWDVVRVFLVEGLDTGQAQQEATMLARGLAATGIPTQGTLAPGPGGQGGAVLVSYSSEPNISDDSSCYVICQYNNQLPNGSTPFFILNDDTSLVVESTELHPKDKSSMVFSYTPPANKPANPPLIPGVQYPDVPVPTDPGAGGEPHLASFRYSRPLRKVVLSGYIQNRNLDTYRNMVGSVNDNPWLGKPRGYWRFDDFRQTGILFGSITHVELGFTTRNNENWMSWEVFYSSTIGRRIAVNPLAKQKILDAGYFYYWLAKNGIIAAGLYPMANFGAAITGILKPQ